MHPHPCEASLPYPFTEEVEALLRTARRSAQRRRAAATTSAHVLEVLLATDTAVAEAIVPRDARPRLSTSLDAALGSAATTGASAEQDELPAVTTEVKRALEHALHEARQLGAAQARPIHLALGLLAPRPRWQFWERSDRRPAVVALQAAGIDLVRVRAALGRVASTA